MHFERHHKIDLFGVIPKSDSKVCVVQPFLQFYKQNFQVCLTFFSKFFTAHQGLIFYFFIFTLLTVQSAAPQTALWGGPGPKLEPHKRQENLPVDHHTSF